MLPAHTQLRRYAAVVAAALLTCLVWVAAACGRVSSSERQLPSGWNTHRDPMGFSVAVPPGWSARGEKNTGRVDVEGPEGARVTIWPVFLGNAQVESGRAGLVAQRLAMKVWPEAVSGTQTLASASVVRLSGQQKGAPFVAVFSWVASPQGTAGCFYGMTAPAARYHSLTDTFAGILSSLRVAGAPASAGGQSSSQYVTWADPREHAFTLEIPAGWGADGGMIRFAAIDTRPNVLVDSPDNQIHIRYGDSNVPGFVVPSPMLNMAGLTEGRWYSIGAGVNLLVKRFLPGPQFLQEYVRTLVAPSCGQVNITGTRDRGDVLRARNIPPTQSSAYGSTQITAGDINFTCEMNGQPQKGYFFATTQISANAQGGLWYMPFLAGYLAAPAKADEAHEIATYVAQSFREDPQWAARQSNTALNVSQIYARTNAQINQTIMQGYESRQHTMDEISRRRENAILGLEDVVDTNTGEKLKIESGSNYYWMDNRGNIVGTNTDTLPNLDFHALARIP